METQEIFYDFSVSALYLVAPHVQPTPTPPLWAVSFPSTCRRPERRSSSLEPPGSPGAPECPNQVLQAEQRRVKRVTGSHRKRPPISVRNNRKDLPVSRTPVQQATTKERTGMVKMRTFVKSRILHKTAMQTVIAIHTVQSSIYSVQCTVCVYNIYYNTHFYFII